MAPDRDSRAAAVVAAVALFLFTVYRFRGAVLTFFFLDDYWVMRDASRIRLESLWDLTQFFHFGHAGFLMYRPLSTTAYSYVLQALFGFDSSGHHAAQLLIFAFNVCLVFDITRRLTESIRGGLAVALLYLLAPGQAVDAYWLSAFTVTGTAVWLLLMMWAWVAFTATSRTVACVLFQICGLLASEHAVVGPILCSLLAAVRREPWRRSVATLVPSAAIVVTYLLAKIGYFAVARRVASAYAVTLDVSIWLKHLGQYLIACFNLLTLWNPAEAGFLPLGIGVVALALLALWRVWRGGDAWRLLAAGILIFAVSLGPVLVLRTHYKNHYVCLPAFGVALAVLACCQLLTSRHWRWLVLGMAASLLVVDVATSERAWRQDPIFRLVVNGSATAAVWVGEVQRAAQEGATEVLVPANAVTNFAFVQGQLHTYFPAMPERVTKYGDSKPPPTGPGQKVVNLPFFARLPPLSVDNPAPGWDPRWDWLRRLGAPPP